MLNNLRTRIKHLQAQSEGKRLRAVSLLALGSSFVVGVLWLGVLLPAQLYFSGSEQSNGPGIVEQFAEQRAAKENVQGITSGNKTSETEPAQEDITATDKNTPEATGTTPVQTEQATTATPQPPVSEKPSPTP